jgi:hypothetical protein
MDPAVSRAQNGEFVVVWEEIAGRYANDGTSYQYRVAARRFNRDGTGAGQQFTVFQQPKDGPHVGGYPRVFHPDVATDVNDGFVVVWGNYEDDPEQPEFGRIWAQQFNASNDAQAPKFQLNKTEAGTNYNYGMDSVATAPDGGFLVVWNSAVALDVVARRFSPSGMPSSIRT